MITLYSHQEQAKELLLTHKHSCLFMEARTGKTYPTCEAILEVAPNGKVLILSTKTVIEQTWLKLTEYELPKQTVKLNFEKAISKKYIDSILSVQWDVIVVDECHKIKSHNSKISKLVYKITKNTKYVWGLSGTPRGNSDIDIFNIYHNLNVAGFGTISYTKFMSTMCVCKPVSYGNPILQPVDILPHKKEQWDNIVNKYCIKILLSDIKEMPKLNIKEVVVPYVKTEQYHMLENGILQIKDYEDTFNKLTALNKLRQCCNGYVYVTDDLMRRETKRIHANTKLNYLPVKDYEPTVIVYHFTEDLYALRSKYKHAVTSIDEFQENNKSIFKPKENILLIQETSCEGYDLQFVNTLIFYTMDYSYIKFNQMYHRIWGLTQKDDSNLYVMIMANSIEQQVWNIVNSKGKLADLFMSVKRSINA